MVWSAVLPVGKDGNNTCVGTMDNNERLAAERLEKELEQQRTALKQERELEKRQKKARRKLARAQRSSARSKARRAAKEAAPDRFVIVLNGRPVEVRAVERPSEIVGLPPARPQTRRKDSPPSPGCGPSCNGRCRTKAVPMGSKMPVKNRRR